MARPFPIVWLLASFLLALLSPTFLAAQTDVAKARTNRFVPIPLQGNLEAMLLERLRMADENETLKKMVGDLLQRHQDLKLDPHQLGKLDLENPAFRSLLQKLQGDKRDMQHLTVSDLKKIQRQLQNVLGSKPNPVHQGLPQFEQPSPPQKNSSNLARLTESWLRKANKQALGGMMRDSPAFAKGLEELRALAEFNDGAGWGGSDGLPDYLRLSGLAPLDLTDSLIGSLDKLSLPSLPDLNLPSIRLGNVNLPSLSAPGVGGIPDFGGGLTLAWILLVAIGLVVGWRLLRRLRIHSETALAKEQAPWPVDPRRVSSRAALVKAFDHLAVLLLGPHIRSWHHRAIAAGVLKSNSSDLVRQAMLELSALYEQARYTAGPEALSSAEQASARHDLCLLAGLHLP